MTVGVSLFQRPVGQAEELSVSQTVCAESNSHQNVPSGGPPSVVDGSLGGVLIGNLWLMRRQP